MVQSSEDSVTEVSRRSVLVAAAMSFLAGCVKAPPFIPSCPLAAGSHTPVPALLIDAHCHIFNGTDLPVKEFLVKVVEKGEGGEGIVIASDLLQDLAWNLAPTGDEELKVLKRMVAHKTTAGNITLKQHRDRAYLRAKSAIQKALDKAAKRRANAHPTPPAPPPPLRAAAPPVLPVNAKALETRIRQLLSADTYEDYKKTAATVPSAPAPPPPLERGLPPGPQKEKPAAPAPGAQTCPSAAGADRTVPGMVNYVIQNFHYRYVMIDDYLNSFTYTTGSCVDLMVAALVDYDWWLTGSDRRATQTPLETQVQVMKHISILSRGQVHGLVPFDPLHQVAFRAGKSSDTKSPLQLVQDAVMREGCIGVKMYPPMGFAPLGNTALHDFWKGAGLPAWVNDMVEYSDGTCATFGERLDQALEEFYSWCIANDVPVMAHSTVSNGTSDMLAELAGADHWIPALKKFPQLRISFGHLGDFSDTLNLASAADADKFIAFMSTAPNAYADSGYFSAILTEPGCMQGRLVEYYTKPGSLLPNRLMYGTDWNLLITQGDIQDYFQYFVRAFQEIDKTLSQASQLFFGRNAAEWLGLAGGKTRQRLDEFYSKNGVFAGDIGIKQPGWASKLILLS